MSFGMGVGVNVLGWLVGGSYKFNVFRSGGIRVTRKEITMCSKPKMPKASSTPAETVATPTAADATVTKAKANQRNKTAGNSGRDIRTSARGLADEATTTKKKLLGE